MTDNIVTAAFSGGRRTRTEHLWQYDYGQVLRITGLELPETFEVHFSNTRDRGAAKTSIGTAEAVSIPDEFLTSGADIYAWVFLHTGADDGETEYMIIIPVRRRAKPSDDAPTPQEQSAITQAIAALNSAVVDVQEAVDAAADARTSAASAEASATAAAASEASVEADADRASEAAAAAETAQAGAETAQTGAESARDAAAQVLESIPADYTELSDSVSDLKSDINHRNIYRGKNLGTAITAAQKAAISSGTFDDLFVGDYWTLNGKIYRIADMDYWYNCGDTAFTKHHLVMVPSGNMYNAVMNDTTTTNGGYVGSKMYTEGLDNAKATIQAAFGDMLQTHREILINAVTGGHPSGYAWYDSTVELMNEIMVYGCHVYAPAGDGQITPIKYTIDKQQLALFQLNPRMVNINRNFWLRDVVSSANFADVNSRGSASHHGASLSSGVRPVFAIG